MYYYKLLTCFNQLALLQVAYLVRSTCTIEICLLTLIDLTITNCLHISVNLLHRCSSIGLIDHVLPFVKWQY